MIVHWMSFTGAGIGTVHFCCFMNGCGVAIGYPHKAFFGWKPGKVTFID